MYNILVLGAYGYIGSSLCKDLAISGHKVTVFGRSYTKCSSKWHNLMDNVIVGDISNENDLKPLLKLKFEVIINLISLDQFQSHQDLIKLIPINILPSWKFLKYFESNGLKKFIYFSTQQVFGRELFLKPYQSISPRPNNHYGLTHLMTEQIVNYFNFNSTIECINVRISNGYGSPELQNKNCWELVVNNFCKNAFLNNNIKMLSDGSPKKDFIHISDICSAIKLIIMNNKPIKENTLNIASSETISIVELAHLIRKIHKEVFLKDVSITFMQKENQENFKKDVTEQINDIDISGLKKLGYKAKINLEDGILEIFNYLKSLSNN